jgi:hypothetical protein
VIIDEEHRFGVAHKEKLKVLKTGIDVLTMTATPIPRTLQLSFLGIRDLYLIQTAPPRRQAIKTYIIKEDDLTLKSAIEKEGFDQVLNGIILPFLEKLSLLWLTGSISAANEQFINHLIRQKIAVYCESLPLPEPEKEALRPKAILFEPFADEQELMLTLVNYLFRSKGCKTMYLGKGINLKNLSAAYSVFKPNCLYVMLSEGNAKNNPQDFLNKLGQEYPDLQIIVNSKAVLKTHLLPDNVVVLENFNEFLEFLEEIE